jgi:outer membrane protein OmpA-like peptidoglycan-associated protein
MCCFHFLLVLSGWLLYITNFHFCAFIKNVVKHKKSKVIVNGKWQKNRSNDVDKRNRNKRNKISNTATIVKQNKKSINKKEVDPQKQLLTQTSVNDSVKINSQLNSVLHSDTIVAVKPLLNADSSNTITLNNIIINFPFDDSNITSKDEVLIKEYVNKIDLEKIKMIAITGFTDSDGSDDYNKKLSLSRAKKVYDYIKLCGVPASKLSIKWLGESSPKNANTTVEEKSENRRVETVQEE